MNRKFTNATIAIALVIIIAGAGWWYLNQSTIPSTSGTTELPTTQQTAQKNTNPTSQSAPTLNTSVIRITSPNGEAEQKLSLESNGLGSIRFGFSSEQVVMQLTTILGASSKDTGWIDNFSAYGTCPGDKIRVVEWNRLRVFFGDTPFGTQKFFQYAYTGRDTTNQTPILATSNGVTLGMSKSEVVSRYPQAQITPWIENYESMHLEPYNKKTNEYLGGTFQDGKVSWISGGIPCLD